MTIQKPDNISSRKKIGLFHREKSRVFLDSSLDVETSSAFTDSQSCSGKSSKRQERSSGKVPQS
jgi:hypothetical protein